MSGQTYQVNYIVNVDAANAQTAINSFKRAVASMDRATKPIVDLQNKVRGLVETMAALHRGQYTVKVETRPATKKLGKLINALKMVQREIQTINGMGVNLGPVRNGTRSSGATSGAAAGAAAGSRGKTKSSSRTTTKAARTSVASKPSIYAPGPTNLGYKLWGPTPLPNNGGMAIDMLKGMGIAYGIAGMGTLISNVVDQATDYDNTMKTVENILKSHDSEENFSGRFASMSKTVRDVGMKTKFKVTEVADAAKFLAMAGLDVNAIQKSISPIADIALVGDTDLGKTADLVTNIMTAYNFAPEQMRNVADIMTNTFTMSNTTLTEIAESYKYAASLLSAGDVSFEEATAAIGVLGDAGIKGSQAGTTLRTIMANIVNPTKKQAAAWKGIGVSLTDKNGKRKDPIEIFKELNAKNLDVDAYYKIFHKTAASGAVALAAHVDKWQNVYDENFLAQGMTRRLAEEKQNTLQGLWAQLTSVFTDQGVTAFSGVQGMLRGLMKKAIDWLHPDKNPAAKIAFKKIANDVMEFVDTLITASKWFVWFFEHFGAFIKMWAKFQLMIWPVVKAVSAIRSLSLSVLGLRKVGHVVLGLAGSFKSLSVSAEAAAASTVAAGTATTATTTTASRSIVSRGVAGAAMSPFGFTAGIPGMAALSRKDYVKAVRGWRTLGFGKKGPRLNLLEPKYVSATDAQAMAALGLNTPDDARLYNQRLDKQYVANKNIFNKRVRKLQVLNGAKNLGKMGVGTAGVMLGMSQMTKDNANWMDVTSGGLFAAAGTAAMVGGPVGWIAAAALAVGGLGFSAASAISNVNALSNYVTNFTQSHQLLDGALTNGNSRTEKYLEFVWRKNYDINDLIQRRIELTKELLGIETVESTTTKDVGNELFKEFYEKFYAADSMWGSSSAAEKAADMFNKYAEQYGLKIQKDADGDWSYTNAFGRSIKFANPDGSTDSNDVVMYDVAAALEMLHGQYRSKIVDENQRRLAKILYGNGTLEDAQNWKKTFAETYGPTTWGNLIQPNQWTEDTDVAKFWTGEDVAKSRMGAELLWKSMYQIVNAQDALINFKTKKANNALTDLDVVRAIRWGDYDILGQTLADYNPNNIMGWYKHLGYDPVRGIFQDPTGKESGETMAQLASGHMQKLLEAIKRLGLETDPCTQALQGYANTMMTLAQSFVDAGSNVPELDFSKTYELNGQKWKYNPLTKVWELVDDNGQPIKMSQALIDMSNNMSNLLTTAQNVNSNWPTLFPVTYSGGFGASGGWTYNSNSPYNWNVAQQDTTAPANAMLLNPLTANLPATPQSTGLPFAPMFNSPLNRFSTTTTQTGLTTVTMDNKHLQNALANQGKSGATLTNGVTSTTDDKGGRGTKSSDYGSSKKDKAIPKQINIRIDNLMKVDKIDLTKPEQAAVIDKIKREVAYALYEAAGDGVMMLNNLAGSNA